MKPIPCQHCATAQVMPWRVYNDNCPECQIRCIANMNKEDRPALYERFEDEIGHRNVLAIKEKVGLEVVRLRLLREVKKP